MKNIYLIPTDKPSRLAILNSGKLNLGARFISSSNSKAQHIYITNNEKPKYRDWCLSTDKNFLIKLVNIPAFSCDKKVILTTDPDLIADGIQAIDDDFLEWFVKNSSCEWVEVEIKPMFPMYSTFIESIDNPPFYGNLERKIIIPQEEPKQETVEEAAERLYPYRDDRALKRAFKHGAKLMKDNYVEYISQLENQSFVGWSEESINGYLTACSTLKNNL